MYSMTAVQKRMITLSPDGPLDAEPSWTNSNPAAASLDVTAGGLSGYVIAVAPGSTTVTIGAASQGNPLAESLDFVVTIPPATTLGVAVGPVEAQ